MGDCRTLTVRSTSTQDSKKTLLRHVQRRLLEKIGKAGTKNLVRTNQNHLEMKVRSNLDGEASGAGKVVGHQRSLDATKALRHELHRQQILGMTFPSWQALRMVV